MSIKIYNGFRLRVHNNFVHNHRTDVLDLKHLTRFIQSARTKMQAAAEHEALTLLAKQCAYMFDRQTIGLSTDHDDDSSIIATAFMDITKRDQKVRLDNKRDPVYDFEVSATLHPLFDQGRMLGILFCENGALYNRWFELDTDHVYVEEYMYFDNSDRPDRVTEQDWQQRADDWNNAVLDSATGVPSLNGFTVQLVEEGIPTKVLDTVQQVHKGNDTLLGYLPQFEQRVHSCTIDLMYSRYLERNQIEHDNDNIFRVFRQFNQYLKSSDGVAEDMSTRDQVRGKLKEHIELADLTGK